MKNSTRMKFATMAAGVLAMTLTMALGTHAADSAGVSFFDHAKVATVLAKGGTLISQPDLTVLGSHRGVAGQVEVHDKETDVFYVTEGEATIVTGGKMIGGKQKSPGQMLGKSIEGGETRHLVKGDVMVIPRGTPHWFKEVPRSISYYVVKVIQ